MLNVVFTSPYSYYVDPTLDPADDPVNLAARVQLARLNSHHHQQQDQMHNKNRTNMQEEEKYNTKPYAIADDHPPSTKLYDHLDTDSPSPPPSIMKRRASLENQLAGSEVPASTVTDGNETASHRKKLSKEEVDKIDMPYDINAARPLEEPMGIWNVITKNNGDTPLVDIVSPNFARSSSLSSSNANGLPRIELSMIASSNPRELAQLCRNGFATSQRKDVWPRLLVLPSSVVHVDISSYYKTIESVWHLPNGFVTDMFQGDDTDTLTDHQLEELRDKLPTKFPSPPLLGRREQFDWNLAFRCDSASIIAQKRLLCTLCAVHELTFAPQLPPLVCVVYHALDGDEPRTFSFVSAMIDRSKRDEHFLLLSPVSLEVFMIGFRKAFEKPFDALQQHFTRNDFDYEHWFREQVLNGFMTANLPSEAILRVWDAAIVAGTHTAYLKFALCIFARFETYLLSGSSSKVELESKLSKLMSMINIPSFFQSTLRDGLGWHSKDGWWNKNELAKLTTPNKETNITITPECRQLEPVRYRIPIFFQSNSTNEQYILNLKMCYQLYGGLLPPSTTRADPYCCYSTEREGHSLKSLMRSIWDDESHNSAGTLILVRTVQRKIFGIFFNRLPHRPANDAGVDGKTLRSVSVEGCQGFVVTFNADDTKSPMVQLFTGGSPPKKSDAEQEASPNAVTDEFNGRSSLPILPIEGGPKSDHGKRRGSLAIILDALHLKKNENELNPANSDSSNRLIADVAPLSPFKHPSIRILDPDDANSDEVEDDADCSRPTLGRARTTPLTISLPSTSASISAPSSPQLRPLSTRTGASSTNSSTMTTPMSSTASTRRQSIVASLERAWSFIDSVPTPVTQTGPTPFLNNSPAVSRKSSVTGPSSRSDSPRTLSNKGRHAFFPSAPTSVTSSPRTQKRAVNIKNRTTPVGVTLPPRGPMHSPTDAPAPSPHQPIGMRQRSMTVDHRASTSDSPTLERHLSMQRVREAGWDAIANHTASSSGSSTIDSKNDLNAGVSGVGNVTQSSDISESPIGSASHHYRVSITSPPHATTSSDNTAAGAPTLLRQSSSSSSSRRNSLTPVRGLGAMSSSDMEAEQESERLTYTPSPEVTGGDHAPVLRRHNSSSSPTSNPSNSSRPLTPVNCFESTSAAFRAQHPFKLEVDVDNETSGHQPPLTHLETVQMAVKGEKHPQSTDSRAPSSLSVLLSDSNFILHDSSSSLLFSLNQTLDESVIQCNDMTISEGSNGHVDCSTVEAWSFIEQSQ